VPRIPSVYSPVTDTKDPIDATICEMSGSHPASYGRRLTVTLETIDTPDVTGTLVAGQFTGSFSTEGCAVSKTTL
jgi:hypothetical protein